MPGPSSRATTTIPLRAPSCTSSRMISPRRAYWTMLRATSEIAVAISVWSVLEKPRLSARRRPAWRATTRSVSPSTRIRSGTCALVEPRVEERQSLLEVQGGVDVLQAQSELHHRERDVGLD